MTREHTNPYRPPLRDGPTPDGNQPAPPSLAFVLVLLVTVLYNLMLILVLLSSPPDRIPALIFSLNTPILVIWLNRLRRRHPNAAMTGVVAAGVQVILGLALMLPENAQRGTIAVTCGVLVLAYLILAYISGRQTGNEPAADPAGQQQ